jgi:predicted amidohydrolase
MPLIRVATTVPRQEYTQEAKLQWLDKALSANPSDLFLSAQEYFGGGSIREICRLKNIATDDFPVTEEWLKEHVGGLARKHNTHIGIGATVNRMGVNTEDFLYFDNTGKLLGHHSKMALPMQDLVMTNGASKVTPEIDAARAATPILLPALELRVGTVFCWQVFFVDLWNDLMRNGCTLVVHPMKFAPRAWYQKGQNAAGEETRTGFTQGEGSDDPESDPLGWIRKLKYESEFKQLPIAVTCNTWAGGEKFLALVGWVDEVTHRTNLLNVPSIASNEAVVVTQFNPELFDNLKQWHRGLYGKFKDDFVAVSKKTMMRKAMRIEARTRAGQTEEKLNAHVAKHSVEPIFDFDF